MVPTTAQAEAGSVDLDASTRAWYRSRESALDRVDLAVVDRVSDVCVGEVVLNGWEPADRRCNFRTLLGPDGRDRGLGTEAIRLLLDHAFAVTDLYRIELEVHAFNPRARHVYERVGFRVEGTRRAALRFDGRRIDTTVLAILRPDWLAGRG